MTALRVYLAQRTSVRARPAESARWMVPGWACLGLHGLLFLEGKVGALTAGRYPLSFGGLQPQFGRAPTGGSYLWAVALVQIPVQWFGWWGDW
jgi:hypothetical protein